MHFILRDTCTQGHHNNVAMKLGDCIILTDLLQIPVIKFMFNVYHMNNEAFYPLKCLILCREQTHTHPPSWTESIVTHMPQVQSQVPIGVCT